MKPTDISNPEYFHKVVDCQYACPAHTPVPEYIRLIAAGRYDDAYMINWESNVFPGILGRTCDRPCEPACRRGRIAKGEEPVAICRLKRVAADNKMDIRARLPKIPEKKNGKRIALIGAGPASLTVARDLMPLGYSIDIYDNQHAGGGMMRSQIPSFRLPGEVLDEEVNYILDMGVVSFFNTEVDSLKEVLDKDYDAVFVGTGAPGASCCSCRAWKRPASRCTSASSGWPAWPSSTPRALASASWSWVAATRQWTAVVPPVAWVARMCGWWCAAPSPT